MGAAEYFLSPKSSKKSLKATVTMFPLGAPFFRIFQNGQPVPYNPDAASILSLSVQATIEYDRLGGLSDKCLFLTVLEVGSLRSESQDGRVLVRTLFQQQVANFSSILM